MKRIILSLLLTVIAVAGWGQEFTIGKINYVVTGENTCIVTNVEYDITGDIVVPSSVSYDNVTYDVKSISEAAFIGTNCTSIVVSEGITTIGMYAFLSCPKLTSVTLPSTLIGIVMSDNRYMNATPAYLQIEKFINKSSIANEEAAGKLGISFCERRTDDGLVINNNFIEAYLNYGNNLSLNIPEGITGAQFSVLSSNNIFTSITIPSTFTLGDSSYPRGISYALKSEFKNNTKYPDEEVAAYLGVLLFDEITADGFIIDNHALVGYCGSNEPGLSITIPEGVTKIEQIDPNTWSNLETLVIPESVTEISPFAFAFCNSLKYITIKGQSVNIGASAFTGCYNIKNITLYATTPPNSGLGIGGDVSRRATLYIPDFCIEKYKMSWPGFGYYEGIEIPGSHKISADNINYILLDYDKTGWVIGANKYYQGDIVIPSSISYNNQDYAITKIDGEAFQFALFTSVVVSEGITTIGANAFNACRYLQKLILPSTLNTLTNEFSPSSTPYYIQTSKFVNNSQIDNTEVTNRLGFKLCDEITDEGLAILDHAAVKFQGFNGSSTTINVPEGVTKIESGALCGDGFGAITFPSTLTSIGDGALESCQYITSIVIPESVNIIGYKAFYGCTSLTSMTIKGQNVEIGYEAFAWCPIENFKLYATTPPAIGSDRDDKNATLYVPYTSVNAYKAANGWKYFKNIIGFVPEGYYLHHDFNCKDEELTSDEYAYLTKDDSEKRYVNGDGHEYDGNGMCKHCGEPLKCAKPTYDAENGLRCKTEGVQYEIKSGYWIATSPEMPADISLTIIAKKDGYIDSDPLLLSISKLDLNNDGKFDINDLKYLQDKVLEKE